MKKNVEKAKSTNVEEQARSRGDEATGKKGDEEERLEKAEDALHLGLKDTDILPRRGGKQMKEKVRTRMRR